MKRTIELETHRPFLQGGRNQTTCQVMVMAEEDRKLYGEFIKSYVSALNPDGLVELQLAQRLAQDTWRINRVHAIEENIFALGHEAPFANLGTINPQVHTAFVQALTLAHDPKVFIHLSLYEQRITKNFHANMKLLLKLQSLRQPLPQKEKTLTASAGSAPTADGRFISQNQKTEQPAGEPKSV